MKKILVTFAAFMGIFCSMQAHAQFNPSSGFQTISNQCGIFFLQGSTYYNSKGISIGASLPTCIPPMSIQNSSAALLIPAKFTNATLPTCNLATTGLEAIETDGAASPVYAATATGGGTLSVPVNCTNSNGTFSWTNH